MFWCIVVSVLVLAILVVFLLLRAQSRHRQPLKEVSAMSYEPAAEPIKRVSSGDVHLQSSAEIEAFVDHLQGCVERWARVAKVLWSLTRFPIEPDEVGSSAVSTRPDAAKRSVVRRISQTHGARTHFVHMALFLDAVRAHLYFDENGVFFEGVINGQTNPRIKTSNDLKDLAFGLMSVICQLPKVKTDTMVYHMMNVYTGRELKSKKGA